MTYRHMTIDSLATALEACNPLAIVVAGTLPIEGDTGSYRGAYARLRIGPYDVTSICHPEICAADLAERLRDEVGQTLLGYKGGKFLMTNDTRVYCAAYGRSGPMIIGVIEHKDANTVELVLCDEY